MNEKFVKQILKTILFLTALTLVCAFLVRTLTDSETLSDYAARNPELAYGNAADNITEEDKSDSNTENEIDSGDETKANFGEEDTGAESDNSNENSNENNSENPNKPQNTDAIIDDTSVINPDRITYKEGFYYEPLSEEIKMRITGISYPITESESSALNITPSNIIADSEEPVISYDDLCYLSVLYYDFSGNVQTGELICNKGIAEDLAAIFHELYLNEYQIEKIKLIDEYQGNDEESMKDNNTSCFNYRVVPNSDRLSKHALGCAIDINPFYNPYITNDKTGGTIISPTGSDAYADRSASFEHKIDEEDLCYKLFKEHGFEWGGDWKNVKDYQHFQKVVKILDNGK